MWKGIDVSDNQGVISWNKVASAGCQFAILRSVRRSGKPDSQFAANVNGCITNGIPLAVYKYTYAITPSQAAAEAAQVADLLAAHGLSCPVWWDVEDPSLQELGPGVLTGLIQTARNTISAAGLDFGIYTGKAFYEAGYFDVSAFDCPFWVARYPSSAYFDFAAAPPADKYRPQPAQPLVAWQYTSKGRIDGVSGVVDLNACYIPFWDAPEDVGYYLQEIWHGSSIAHALESIGEDGSYQRRAQIAAVNGIQGYSGTAAQNTHMLNLLRTGQLRIP